MLYIHWARCMGQAGNRRIGRVSAPSLAQSQGRLLEKFHRRCLLLCWLHDGCRGSVPQRRSIVLLAGCKGWMGDDRGRGQWGL